MAIPYLECAGFQDFLQAVREAQIERLMGPSRPVEAMARFRHETIPGRMGRWITVHLEATCLMGESREKGKPLYILRHREFVYERSEYDQDNPERFAALRAGTMQKFKAAMEAERVAVQEDYSWSGE
ncbi:MAG: hypothetical protein IT210_19205 [Armatimonadetes bacterium]|nr:hypothetical protein [Armatimonadota bacterium]